MRSRKKANPRLFVDVPRFTVIPQASRTRISVRLIQTCFKTQSAASVGSTHVAQQRNMRHNLLILLALALAATIAAFPPAPCIPPPKIPAQQSLFRRYSAPSSLLVLTAWRTTATRLNLFWFNRPSSNSTKECDEKNGCEMNEKKKPFVFLIGRPQQNWSKGTKSYTNPRRQDWLNPKKKGDK